MVPPVAELLADPAFAPLAEWLAQRQVDPAELQQQVNELLEDMPPEGPRRRRIPSLSPAMTSSDLSDRPLAQLLSDLEEAVRRGDAAMAQRLEQQILQRLARQAAESAAIEQQVKALMAQLAQAEQPLHSRQFRRNPASLRKMWRTSWRNWRRC